MLELQEQRHLRHLPRPVVPLLTRNCTYGLRNCTYGLRIAASCVRSCQKAQGCLTVLPGRQPAVRSCRAVLPSSPVGCLPDRTAGPCLPNGPACLRTKGTGQLAPRGHSCIGLGRAVRTARGTYRVPCGAPQVAPSPLVLPGARRVARLLAAHRGQKSPVLAAAEPAAYG